MSRTRKFMVSFLASLMITASFAGVAAAADSEDGGGQYPKLCRFRDGNSWASSPVGNC
jgi:hypothetical protein